MASNPVAVIRQNLNQMAPEFRAALPAHISVEKFSRVAMTAIQNNPALQNADRTSLFGSIVRLAQDGLLPDGRDAAIVMFGNKAQAMPMIAGILRKIRQSNEVAFVSAQVVYENDEFVWSLGFEESVTHNPPALDKPRGKAIGAYATAVLKDGSRLLEVMSLEEIEKVRSVSRAAKNGPWVQWWSEMARKTVMRRLSKRLPMSTDLEDSLARDETMVAANDTVEQPIVEQIPSAAPSSKLDALEQQIEAEAIDADTGEIIDANEGHADTPRGEQVTLADALEMLANAETPADVNARYDSLKNDFDGDAATALTDRRDERIKALKGGK